MMEEKEQRIRKKLSFFNNEKIRIHVKRVDRTFWRGFIINKKNDDVYEFLEDKFGKVLLFVDDIWEVNEVRENRT